MDKAHEFDPKVAAVYGINAAIIFQHIAYLSQESPSKWVDLSLQELTGKYPYMGRKAIWLALRKLVFPGRRAPALVARKGREMGVGFLYRPIPDDGFCDIPHKFSVDLASNIGLVPAIIYRNVSYWVRKNWLNRAEIVYSRLDPARFDYHEPAMQEFALTNSRRAAVCFNTVDAWVKQRSYIARRTAFLGFDTLLDEGLLTHSTGPHRIPVWSLPARVLNSFKRNMLEASRLENSSAERKSEVQKGNALCRKETPCAERKHSFSFDGTEDESVSSNSAPVRRSTSEEELPASQVKRSVKHYYDGFGFAEPHRAKVFADAHDQVSDLNKPKFPSRKKARKKPEGLGWKHKRPYRHHDDWAELNE
jgi:hypothetical protein